MRQSQKQINQRRDKIFNLLLENNEIYVNPVADILKVSPLTVRRDLDFFEKKHYVERFYGGARLLSSFHELNPSRQLERLKNEIAKKAASLIDPGDIIFINSSSTALLTLKYLQNKEVTVITNNANVLAMNIQKPLTVILTGGEVRHQKKSLIGDFVINMLSTITASKAIIGCSGLSVDHGLSTSIHSEVSINYLMLQNCKGHKICVCDHTKLGNDASFSMEKISAIDTLITDDQGPKEILDKFKGLPSLNTLLVSA